MIQFRIEIITHRFIRDFVQGLWREKRREKEKYLPSPTTRQVMDPQTYAELDNIVERHQKKHGQRRMTNEEVDQLLKIPQS